MAAPRPTVLPEVDGYRVEGVLGRGGSGVVYRVTDRRLGRSVALKLLDDDGDPEGRERFRIEAQAAARIIHPNVVQVFGVGEHEGRPYIVMELVDGLPVYDVLRARGPLGPEAVAEIGAQVAEGLAAAAAVGVLHRDVKPHNLLITDAGVVKLADFGLAKLVNGPSGLTQDGTTMGTPHYMSPEQGQGQPLDHRSDQYALGATLYHLLTGAPPFHDDNAVALLLKHAQASLPPVLQRNPACPEALAQAVERMLAKAPDDRFEDFEAVIGWLGGESGISRPERIGIQGGSNGGLLMGATLVQHPELAKAVVSFVGIYDMLRVE
ncbi:MAG: protein kinase, partial [Myxococcales bacterium]|nr:protein kinase [Myxococcales bacterium]